jgi:endonuclease YncB( thermonuclease family)
MRLALCSPGQSEPAGTRTQGNDTITRILADVIFPDGTNVNHTLVKDGAC